MDLLEGLDLAREFVQAHRPEDALLEGLFDERQQGIFSEVCWAKAGLDRVGLGSPKRTLGGTVIDRSRSKCRAVCLVVLATVIVATSRERCAASPCFGSA